MMNKRGYCLHLHLFSVSQIGFER